MQVNGGALYFSAGNNHEDLGGLKRAMQLFRMQANEGKVRGIAKMLTCLYVAIGKRTRSPPLISKSHPLEQQEWTGWGQFQDLYVKTATMQPHMFTCIKLFLVSIFSRITGKAQEWTGWGQFQDLCAKAVSMHLLILFVHMYKALFGFNLQQDNRQGTRMD